PIDALGDWTLVVWLVRVQCRQRVGREPNGGGRLCGDSYGCGDSSLDLDAGGMAPSRLAHRAGGGQRRSGWPGDRHPRSRLCGALSEPQAGGSRCRAEDLVRRGEDGAGSQPAQRTRLLVMLKQVPNCVLITHCTKPSNGYPSNASTYSPCTPRRPNSLRPCW